MKKAVIDIGTISIKFCLAENGADGEAKIIRDVNSIMKLGEGLKKNGIIGPDQLERNAQSVAGFVKEARDSGAEEIVIVGTMALRAARNTADFVKSIKELTKLDVRVLSGEEEAQLSYIAVMSGIPGAPEADLVMFDTGGGSTEFVFGEAGVVKRKLSINVGAMRFTEQYFSRMPVTARSLASAQADIRRELLAGGVTAGAKILVGIGGNVTSMASVKLKMDVYDPNVVNGSNLTLEDIEAQICDYAAKTLEERRKIVGLEPERADVILAGACIVKEIMKLCEIYKLTVSDRGLRHGLMYKLFKK